MLVLYKNILVVESSILSKNELDYMRKTGRINIVRRGCRNTTALISYDSLPTHIQERVKKETGVKDPYKEVYQKERKALLERYIEHNAATSDWFEDYRLPNGKHLPSERQTEYYNNAIVLEAIDKMLIDKKAIRATRRSVLLCR